MRFMIPAIVCKYISPVSSMLVKGAQNYIHICLISKNVPFFHTVFILRFDIPNVSRKPGVRRELLIIGSALRDNLSPLTINH